MALQRGAGKLRNNSGAVEVLPENLAPLAVWSAIQTQWNISIGFGGGCVTGLNYPAVESAMRMLGVKKKHMARVFEAVQFLEQLFLEKERNKK